MCTIAAEGSIGMSCFMNVILQVFQKLVLKD